MEEEISMDFGQIMGPVPTQYHKEIGELQLVQTLVKKTSLNAGGPDVLTACLPIPVLGQQPALHGKLHQSF